jgi:opacity protein-like surface antigen
MKAAGIGLVVISMAAAPHAYAQQPPAAKGHWYATAGAALVESVEYSYEAFDILDVVQGTHETATKGGTAVDVGVGYSFASGFRTEAMASFQKLGGAGTLATLVFASTNPVPSDTLFLKFEGGSIEVSSLDLNAYHDFPKWGWMRPYLGAGVGAASVEIDNGVIVDDQRDTGVKLQVMGGAAFDVSQSAAVYVEARWHTFTGLEFEVLDRPAELTTRVEPDLSGASLRAGVRVAF